MTYTPTTEEVRNAFSLMDDDEATQENFQNFDRWFADVKAQAVHDFVESAVKPEKIMEVAAAGYNESVRELMAQVWEEAYMTGVSDVIADKGATMNPYRKEENNG